MLNYLDTKIDSITFICSYAPCKIGHSFVIDQNVRDVQLFEFSALQCNTILI